jgi:hypothetical protein
MQRLSLEERTQRHLQLTGRAYPPLPAAAVEQQLAKAVFVGNGSFCRVFRVDYWTHAPSEACGQPVVSARRPRGRPSAHAARLPPPPCWCFQSPSPQPVHRASVHALLQIIKLCSAGFQQGQTEEERRAKQAYLTKHWWVLPLQRTVLCAPEIC